MSIYGVSKRKRRGVGVHHHVLKVLADFNSKDYPMSFTDCKKTVEVLLLLYDGKTTVPHETDRDTSD